MAGAGCSNGFGSGGLKSSSMAGGAVAGAGCAWINADNTKGWRNNAAKSQMPLRKGRAKGVDMTAMGIRCSTSNGCDITKIPSYRRAG
jgi:hypothetical protein